VKVAIAGSSGSIGTQTIEVIQAEPDRYEVVGLGVASSTRLVIEQAKALRPKYVAVTQADLRREVADALPFAEIVPNMADLVDAADVVVNGVVGFAGLPVTIETLRAGKRLALANKESLIAAGPIVQPLRLIPGAELVPVDSEHCAVHQCLRAGVYPNGGRELSRLLLTASGGPFRGRSRQQMAEVTVAEALKHPTWSMGPKITIDSATLMNKGLEVIEAHELFGTPYDQIEVVVHPQSIIHSMVEFTDGATIAQLSLPDMRLPIGYALAYPERLGTPFGRIDFSTLKRLDFEPPDIDTFRCLALAFVAGRIGGTAPAWLSAANEIAVEAFLAGEIPFLAIPEVSERVLSRHDGCLPQTVDDIIAADQAARVIAREELVRFTR
jgi:1-deoxy-D-xylulose-5-phosphate reductoisomerase